MRIVGDVEVSNRLLPALNMRGKCRAVRSHLSIGKKPGHKDGSDIFLMICTKQDRNGSKYKIRGNVTQMFTKFVSEGKATIRFNEPPHDVLITKADTIHLKTFLGVMQMVCKGQDIDKFKLTSLAPMSAKAVESLRTKMNVLNRRDYPITTGFPDSLKHLVVSHCTMKRLDSRMLKLRNLTILDLSHNRLQTLPDDMESLPQLRELHLKDNQLTDIPAGFCTGVLQRTLHLLDLSENQFKFLKPHFCQLKALVTVKLDQNQLVCLPPLIGMMPQVRTLTVTKNQLRVLPATFSRLRLDVLDLFDNMFIEESKATMQDRLEFPSLLEVAARAISNQRIPYTREDLPGHLFDLLNLGKWCVCGSVCFRSFVHYLARLDLHRVAASVISIDSSGRTSALAEAFLCSRKCLLNYQKNPYASVWR